MLRGTDIRIQTSALILILIVVIIRIILGVIAVVLGVGVVILGVIRILVVFVGDTVSIVIRDRVGIIIRAIVIADLSVRALAVIVIVRALRFGILSGIVITVIVIAVIIAVIVAAIDVRVAGFTVGVIRTVFGIDRPRVCVVAVLV